MLTITKRIFMSAIGGALIILGSYDIVKFTRITWILGLIMIIGGLMLIYRARYY